MNRNNINEEAARDWDHLVKTAMLVKVTRSQIKLGINNGGSRVRFLSRDEAELHVSDLMITFLSYSDERVAEIINKGSVKSYLTKSVMFMVADSKSSQNYKKKIDKATVSYDNLDEDFDFINTIIASDEYNGNVDKISSIVDEALENVSDSAKRIYVRKYRLGVSVLKQYKYTDSESIKDQCYQTMIRELSHAVKMVKIYLSKPDVSRRIKSIMIDE